MYYEFYRLSFIVYRLLFIVCVVIAISSCGGGGDNSSSNSRIAALQISSANNQVLTIDNDNKVVTYTVAINNFPTGSTGYNVSIAKNHANTEINIINNNCTGRLATGSCTFDVQYNPSAENIRGRPNYGKTDNTITVTATPASGGGALKQIFNVQTSNDPLNVAIKQYDGGYTGWLTGLTTSRNVPTWIYASEDISYPAATSAWPSGDSFYIYPFNVPLIQTYSPDPDTFTPALAIKTRCSNKLIYLVVQNKLDKVLTAGLPNAGVEQADRQNVTIKYHTLIADGVNSGTNNTDRRKIATGRLVIYNEIGTIIHNDNTTIDAHVNIWSGPEDIPALRDLLTTNRSNQNSFLISKLSNINKVAGYSPERLMMDNYAQGVTEIITVHSLLTPQAYTDLMENYLQHHHNAEDIANLATAPGLTPSLNDTFRNSLKAYRAEVAEACSA